MTDAPTLLADSQFVMTGPLRAPRQMLADQSYAGHKSIHDAEEAARLGIAGAPIEGPTHFSQFEPMAAALWGDRWFTDGCVSAHFNNMVIEGESVRATVTSPGPGAMLVRIDAAKADATPVLTGTASIGAVPNTELAARLTTARSRPPERLVILDQLHVGQRGDLSDVIQAGFDTHLGEMYPFTLRQKLAGITEALRWHSPDTGAQSPWGRPIMPIEMLSVLANSGSKGAGFATRQPSVGLFIDLEVRLVNGPVFDDHPYRIDREIGALGESRRTETYWTLSTMIDESTGMVAAEILLHNGVFKDSYPDYPKD